MAIVSYRIYCEECTEQAVVREDRIDDHPWKVSSKINHTGLCPSCNPTVESEEEPPFDHEEVAFEDLDAIGETGADNLREKGIETRGDVKGASNEEILDTAWVGEKGLKSIRKEVQ